MPPGCFNRENGCFLRLPTRHVDTQKPIANCSSIFRPPTFEKTLSINSKVSINDQRELITVYFKSKK